MASATPDLRLPSQLTLVPNLYCLVTVDCPGYFPTFESRNVSFVFRFSSCSYKNNSVGFIKCGLAFVYLPIFFHNYNDNVLKHTCLDSLDIISRPSPGSYTRAGTADQTREHVLSLAVAHATATATVAPTNQSTQHQKTSTKPPWTTTALAPHHIAIVGENKFYIYWPNKTSRTSQQRYETHAHMI